MPRNSLARTDWAAIQDEVLQVCAEEYRKDEYRYLGKAVPRLAQYGVTSSSLNSWLRHNGHLWQQVKTAVRKEQARASVFAPPTPRPKDIHDYLELPPKQFAVRRAAPVKPHSGRYLRTVVLGDTHMGFEDPDVLRIVLGVMKDVKPHVVVHVGDLMDCYSLSRFDKNPHRLMTLQDEIDKAAEFLAQIADVAPNAQRYLLEGNHEDRLRRVIWGLPGAAAALPRLRKFSEAMTWPSLLDLSTIGWTWVGTQGQARTNILPKTITKHGNVVRKWSAYTARAEMEKYGKSGFSGHTHRLALHWHSDANGAHFWGETGCTCKLKPEYVEDPDWQNGCYVATFDQETGAPSIETVYIANGNTIWRNQQYRSAA